MLPTTSSVVMKLKDLSEFGLIERIRMRFPHSGIGEDCAILSGLGPKLLLFTTDLLIEGSHFETSRTDPFRLGFKALSVNLSDIAAMGGTPRFYLVSLGAPPSTPVPVLDELYSGMEAASQGASLVGGDTCKAPAIMIGISLIGEVEEDGLILRSGAKPGDGIYVSGTLGDSALGLKALDEARKGRTDLPSAYAIDEDVQAKFGPQALPLIGRHLSPRARLKLGQGLSRLRLPSAMIDVSDGLISDLGHICRESRVGATIYLNRIPLSEEFKALAPTLGGDIETALSGGEDYELLFTAPALPEDKIKEMGGEVGITCIGEITPEPGIRILDERGQEFKPRRGRGWDHFRDELGETL